MKMIRFPWGIYFRYFIIQTLAYNVILVFLFIALVPLSDEKPKTLWFFFITFFIVNLLVATMTSFRFTFPVHRLLIKTLRLSSKKKYADLPTLDVEDIFDQKDGEFSDFERALDHISRKLKKKKEQLQREREETQAFMSAVQEGLLSVSLDERALYFNSQFASNFLNASQMQQANLKLTQIFRAPEIYQSFRRVIDEKKIQRVNLKLTTQLDNLPRDFSISLAPLRKYKSMDIYGVLGVFHDITDLKKAEKIRIEFVGNASHELRTPLTSIKGYVETLKDDLRQQNTDQAFSFVEIISKNVDRLIDLVNDLLSLSTLEANSELKIESIHPLQISEQVISELSMLAREKNQVIHVRGNVQPFEADAGKVEQVLRNLIINAIKYIPNGKNIHVQWEEVVGAQVILHVIDDGPGIPEQHHARLFERFYRIDSGRSRDHGGTGLGLAIVKHIMQSHGGSVQLKSEVGKGAEFICQFPILKKTGLALPSAESRREP